MVGIYVHTHWGYNRPYSARRWTLTDWAHYLEGLARLGFDTVKVWPQIDTMPVRPTASDEAYLHTLDRAFDMARARFGMKTILTLTANCMGNAHAADYLFAERPYFRCEKRVNPCSQMEMETLLEQRRNTLALIRNADAIAVIDSDPGGFIDSTNADFARLCADVARVFRAVNPKGEFLYWMLAGWETYGAFWKAQRDNPNASPNLWDYQKPDEFDRILALLEEQLPEPWGLTSWLAAHETAIDRRNLRHKALYYPYGAIEGEPVFPLIACHGGLDKTLTSEALRRHPRGVMGNAQTHCLQLYHTFLFAHLAHGRNEADADATGFSERLLPGLGSLIVEGWRSLESEEARLQTDVAHRLRAKTGRSHHTGDLAGLLFGDANRFLLDLAMNLELRASLSGFGKAASTRTATRERLRELLDRLVPYQERVGFVDAYGGPLYNRLNRPLRELGDPGLNTVLADFDNWHSPEVRNGIVPRLIAAMRRYAQA